MSGIEDATAQEALFEGKNTVGRRGIRRSHARIAERRLSRSLDRRPFAAESASASRRTPKRSTDSFTPVGRSSPAAESASRRASSHAASQRTTPTCEGFGPRHRRLPIAKRNGRMSAPLGLHGRRYSPQGEPLRVSVTSRRLEVGAGIEPATSSSQNWRSTVELTDVGIARFRTHIAERPEQSPHGSPAADGRNDANDLAFKETPMGFEPKRSGFAGRRQTTWHQRRSRLEAAGFRRKSDGDKSFPAAGRLAPRV